MENEAVYLSNFVHLLLDLHSHMLKDTLRSKTRLIKCQITHAKLLSMKNNLRVNIQY